MLDRKQKETSMEITRTTDDEQTTLWNGLAGHAWVALQEVFDPMFKPLEDLLVDAVFAGSGRRVLDVGYGTGSTALAVARLLGATGRCIGIDMSDPMITAARACAARESTPASFLHATAPTHAFAPARFDMIRSRFGVMFFEGS
jgi:2-polyprenyl-3-methyl-5-hydroxy-6-metoxy-1,4-benzoquinol methylase